MASFPFLPPFPTIEDVPLEYHIPEVPPCNQRTLRVYLDNGVVFEYEVSSPESAREHADAIISRGYRHNNGEVFEHYPPHRIQKVKVLGGVPTSYPDRVSGT